MRKKIVKASLGDGFEIDIKDAFERTEHDVAHHILGLKAHDLNEVGEKFQLTIKKINRNIPAEMDEAFFNKAFGNNEVTDEASMRTFLTGELEKHFDKDTEKKLEADIVEKMLETKMEFPVDFLKKWLKATNEQELTDEQIENEYGNFERSLKWSLMIKKISSEQDLKVEPEEMRNYVQEVILAQYGIQVSEQFPQEAVDNMINEVMGNREQLKRVYDTLLEEKLFDWIKGKIKTKDKAVSLDDYKELVNKTIMDGKEFKKYATKHLNLNSIAVDQYVSTVENMTRTVIEERPMPFREVDVFSRLIMDRIIFLGTGIDDLVANVVTAQLLFLESADPGRDILVYINSPGGSVTSGLGIYDTMQYIRPDVATICTGLAASMGAVLLAGGSAGKRSALPHARVMIHQPLGGAQGQASDIEITAKLIGQMKKELYEILAKHSGQDYDKVWEDADRDYWMSSGEAKEYGLIDEVLIRKPQEDNK